MDRCRVWESHADPEVRRVSKPGPEPIYPAYVVGDSDKAVEEIHVWVAAVTKPKYTPDQVEDLLRRLLAQVAPRLRSQLRFRKFRWWRSCCSIWWWERRFARLLLCTRACGIGNFAQIFTLEAAGIGAAASAGILPA